MYVLYVYAEIIIWLFYNGYSCFFISIAIKTSIW